MADDGAGVAASLLRPFHPTSNAVEPSTTLGAPLPSALDARDDMERSIRKRGR